MIEPIADIRDAYFAQPDGWLVQHSLYSSPQSVTIRRKRGHDPLEPLSRCGGITGHDDVDYAFKRIERKLMRHWHSFSSSASKSCFTISTSFRNCPRSLDSISVSLIMISPVGGREPPPGPAIGVSVAALP
jgi:hypothetical protein